MEGATTQKRSQKTAPGGAKPRQGSIVHGRFRRYVARNKLLEEQHKYLRIGLDVRTWSSEKNPQTQKRENEREGLVARKHVLRVINHSGRLAKMRTQVP